MSFLQRNLSEDLINETLSNSVCRSNCDESNEYSGVCEALCLKVCPNICRIAVEDLPPPVTSHDHRSSKRVSIIAASAIVSALILVCFIIIFFKSRSRSRSRSSRLRVQANEEIRGEFLDEDHGPIIDHPIWYIRTVGLQPSVISSIAVFKYKKGDGLVEGTDCSVCLSEFQEDETLRLLPKCSHAFHVPCIDTWLRSHVNCPLCRAPIVVNAETSSSGTNSVQAPDEIRVGIPEENRETDEESERNEQESEEQDCQDDVVSTSIDIEEDGTQPVRRSVSLDSLSALRISQAVVCASKGKESNSLERQNAEKMKRSVSCGAKFLLPRYV